MATEQESHEGVPENLRKQLALAVKTIQWSYAIFWSNSSTQTGVLEWGDGYYNGDIKTRKTVQAAELNPDQKRTEQLRELYESLSAAENGLQSRRPSVALSPEDLTDTEWYFLVCMSFVFNIGQGLPGRTLANNQIIWLCNAQYADGKVFSRSLLAKSAAIQTVVCFPHLGGVVELGLTELVLEDPNIIQHIKTSFLKIPYPIVSNEGTKLDHDILITNLDLTVECEEENIFSPNHSLNGFEPIQQAEESIMVSQVPSWKLTEDEISNCVQISMNSSDCISQSIVGPENIFLPSNGEKEECEDVKETSNLQNLDVHYQTVLSTLLKTSHQLILGPCFKNTNNKSSFVSWKKGGLVGYPKSRGGIRQRILKKVLFEVAQMHSDCLLETQDDEGKRDEAWRPEADEMDTSHALSEKRRRERINERFLILESLVPSNDKVDKVSLLDGTIEYLKELERRVEKLEASNGGLKKEKRARRKPCDIAERTSDNYGDKKTLLNKRKAYDFNENEQHPPNDCLTDDVIVSKIDKNVLIEMRCPWRENLLLEIVDAMSSLHLDSHSVQSSNINGILSLTIKAELKGSTLISVGKIREALQTLILKC